jgi:CRP-like cAMP-binding protein
MEATPERVALLKAVPLFAGIDARELQAVLSAAQEVRHPAGKQIVGEGEEGVGFHLILSGDARVEQGGHELSTLHAGQYFGEIALLDGQKRSATVVATTDVVTLSIVVWRFEPLLEQHPRIAIALVKELCARLRRAEASIIR